MTTSEMTPIDWAKRPIEKYADFTGRASRSEYWWFFLALVIAYVILGMVIENLLGLDGMIAGVYGPLTLLLWLATIVPSLAVGIRRLHDTNRSGYWMLLMVPYVVSAVMAMMAVASGSVAGLAGAGMFGIIGLICAIALLVFMVLPGTPGDNRYGPNPLGQGSAAAV